jgi:hypothetical protein
MTGIMIDVAVPSSKRLPHREWTCNGFEKDDHSAGIAG